MYGAKRKYVPGTRSSVSDEVGSRFWKHVCHYVGAIGLLQVRQQSGYRANLALYRAVRRPIVSHSADILNLPRSYKKPRFEPAYFEVIPSRNGFEMDPNMVKKGRHWNLMPCWFVLPLSGPSP